MHADAHTADWLARNATRLFWGFLGLHVALWTALPSLLNANLPLDVIEGFAWGREFDWGYPKHPPLTRWLGDLAAELRGHGAWAQYLLSQISVALAFWAIWRLARTVFEPGTALLAVLLMEGVYFHNYTTPEFNPNVILLPIWSLAVLCFWRAHSSGQLAWWLALGAVACLGFWSKYFMALLLAPLGLLLLLDPLFRRHLATPGPYLAAVIVLLGLTPHLLWMLESDFATIGYAVARASKGGDPALADHLLRPLRFAVEQPLVVLPLVALIWSFGRPRLAAGDGEAAWRRMLLVLWLGPFVLLVALAAVTGWRLRTMWAAPLFVLAGPVFVTWWRPAVTAGGLRRFALVFAALFLLAPLAYGAVYGFGARLTGEAKRTQFSGRVLAERIDREWRARFGTGRPVIIAEHWYGGNTVYYADAASPLRRALLYIGSDSRVTPWVDDAGVRAHGAIAIWRYGYEGASEFDRLPTLLADCRERFGSCEYQEPFALGWQTASPVPRLLIGWAVIPPVAAQGESGHRPAAPVAPSRWAAALRPPLPAGSSAPGRAGVPWLR